MSKESDEACKSAIYSVSGDAWSAMRTEEDIARFGWNAALSYASKQQAERDARIKQLEQQVAFLSHHRAKAETELREILTRGK